MNTPVCTKRSVILKAGHWQSCHANSWWNEVASKAAEIAKGGFKFVLLPPSGAAADNEGYLPHRLYHQHSKYGSKEQLMACIEQLKQRGVYTLADVILNHRVGTHDWGDFTDPVWGTDAVVCDDEWPEATGEPDTGIGFHAGRDINHLNPEVVQSYIDWMLWLKKEIGYVGWRYDYALGIAAHFFGEYTKETAPAFAFAEVWPTFFEPKNADPHRQFLCNWLDQHQGRCSVLDFTTKGLLNHALSQHDYECLVRHGSFAGLIQWWPEKAVTFVDNHDTASFEALGQNKWPVPDKEVMQGYALILTHPGVPMVYWPHYFNWKLSDKISELIEIRRFYGLTALSKIEIEHVNQDHYAAVIDERIAVKIGRDDWKVSGRWHSIVKEANYQVWVRAPRPRSLLVGW